MAAGPRTQEEILRKIPNRGLYSAVGAGGFFSVVWRHGVSERVVLQFLGPNAAKRIAADLNYVHIDEHTGDVSRNWELCKIAWWDGKPEPSRIILAH
jgi:hypothetical protein